MLTTPYAVASSHLATIAWAHMALLGAGCLLLLWLVLTFNRLVKQRNRVREGESGVDVQLKRRHELIPNIVATVKGYAAHEHDTLQAVVDARNAASEAQAIPDRADRETKLSGSLNRLMLLVEAYPELKADKSFRDLQGNLVEVEDAIQYARRYYNGTVRDYNTTQESFPALLVAGAMGHKARPFFELEALGERAVPSVDLKGDDSAS